MKKLFAILMVAVLSLGSTASYADDSCYGRLSDNYSKDSRHFQISIDEFEYESEEDLEKEALKYLLKGMGCDLDEMQNFKCKHISQFQYSYVCSANIEEGYFFISADLVNAVNIIFNRFD